MISPYSSVLPQVPGALQGLSSHWSGPLRHRQISTGHFLTSPYPTPPHPTLHPASRAHLYPHTVQPTHAHPYSFTIHAVPLYPTPTHTSTPLTHLEPHIHPTWSWTPFSHQPGPLVPPRSRRGWAFGVCPKDLESKGSRYFMLLREEISSLIFPWRTTQIINRLKPIETGRKSWL